MVRRLCAIGAICFGAALAWWFLGATLLERTAESDSGQRTALDSLWGTDQTQQSPAFTLELSPAEAKRNNGASSIDVPVDAATLKVDLALDQRQKGLLWYNTYSVAFDGVYRVRNPGSAGDMLLRMPFAAKDATYDDVIVTIDGRRVSAQTDDQGLSLVFTVPREKSASVRVGYRSHGLGSWAYRFSSDTARVRNFTLAMTTNFAAIDFPKNSLAPTQERRTANGYELIWQYSDLITGNGIGMTFPEKLQPGPLAQRITMWAPLALFFYFFFLCVITTIRKIDLHPVNYFFLAAAFFAFHLLFAYTIDRVSIGIAFTLASIVSMFLTISYLRLVAGLRFAAVEAAFAQFFYLILFSLALFNEGYSGISITIGAIVTLFLTMQWTGRIRWSERFGSNAAA